MKNKKIGNEIKWYKPFKLIERNNILEKLTQEQFNIINEYKDAIDEYKLKIKDKDSKIKTINAEKRKLKKEVEINIEKFAEGTDVKLLKENKWKTKQSNDIDILLTE